MARYLVVAHQTAASPELIETLCDIAAKDDAAEFTLLVPATPVKHLLTWVPGDEQQVAQKRAADASIAMQRAGITAVQSVVGEADPLRAIQQEHGRAGPYALTIISTLPQGISRWLRRGLPGQARSKLGIPILHVASRGAALTRTRPSTLEAAPSVSSGPLDLRALAAFRGNDLECPDGIVGRVSEVLYDYVSGEPVWLGIVPSHTLFRTLLVPVHTLTRDGPRLATLLPRERVLGQPHIDVGESFDSLGDEENICRYFALAPELRDIRVLRTGQELPGLERNQQSILRSEVA